MNLFKISLLGLFLSLSLVLPPSVYAVEEVQTAVEGGGASSVVATVGIEDAHIISQDNNKFKIYFVLENEKILQSGVKYGVQLVKEDGSYIVDEKVYDESVTLYENSEQSKEIEYNAPSYLDGTYTLKLVSMNESSFPLSFESLGKVKLTATTKTVEIDTKSCYLQVVGEKSQKKYELVQSVDIKLSGTLKITCTAVNNTAGPVSMTPSFQTRHVSAFGKLAKTNDANNGDIEFKKGEKKTFTLELPKGNMPQGYNLKVFLRGAVSSNSINVRYIVVGMIGSIDRISLDKDYYGNAEKGNITLGWQAGIGSYSRTGVGSSSVPEAVFEATITNDKGKECTNNIKQDLKRSVQEVNTIIPFSVKTRCMNPKVSATLKDKDGNILDQKEFEFKSNPANDNGKMPMKSVVIGAVALLAVVALGVYMKKKNVDGPTQVA